MLLQVHKIYMSVCMILLILGIAVVIALAQNKFMHQYHTPPQQQGCSKKVHVPHPQLKVPKAPKVPKMQPKIEWHKIRHIW